MIIYHNYSSRKYFLCKIYNQRDTKTTLFLSLVKRKVARRAGLSYKKIFVYYPLFALRISLSVVSKSHPASSMSLRALGYQYTVWQYSVFSGIYSSSSTTWVGWISTESSWWERWAGKNRARKVSIVIEEIIFKLLSLV